jgi:hypothetical protein
MFGSMKSTFTSIKVTYADSGNEVEGVQIASNGELVATTDRLGNALIQTSKLGDEITLASDSIYSSTVKVSEINQDEPIKLLKKGINYVYGSLVNNANLSNVKVQFDNQEFKVDSDGKFIAATDSEGVLEIKFKSDNFEQVTGKIDVAEGINVLSNEIQLKLTGSLFFKNRSYIEEQAVTSIFIEAESVNSESILYSEEETHIQGLTPDKEYFVRITGKDVNTREYIVKASNSITPFGDVKLVEVGYYPLLKNVQNAQQLILTDYDGKERTTVVSSERAQIKNIEINNVAGILNYRANESSRNQFPVTRYDLNTGVKTIVTDTNISTLSEDLTVNYEKNLVAVVTQNSTTQILKLYNLKGEFIKDLYSSTRADRKDIEDILIAPDGRTLFIEVESNNEKQGIVVDINSGELIQVASGDLDVLAIDNASSNFVYRLGLFIHSYHYPNRQDSELSIRDIGENFMFDNTNNNVFYFTLDNNRVLRYRYDTNFVEEMIKFDKLNEFDSISQEREYIFTIDGSKVNIFSKNAPTKFKNLSAGN